MSTLTSSGIPAPLGAINRKPKQETFGLIPDDGFRELKTTNQQEIQNPKVHHQKEKPVLRMINKYNIAELSLVDRPVQTTHSGFGAVIPRQTADENARYFRTENRDNFGEKQVLDARGTVEKFQADQGHQAGGQIRPFEEMGIKKISNLVGEVYSKNYDPQEQTDVQRTWLYQQDPGVRAVNDGKTGINHTQFFDNATSLPLGDGMHSQFEFNDKPGAFRRIRTDVTIQKNQIITKK